MFGNDNLSNPEVLAIAWPTLYSHFIEGVLFGASVCQPVVFPTVFSVPHSIFSGHKKSPTLFEEAENTFPLAEKVKAFLNVPPVFEAEPLWLLPPLLLLLLSQPRLKPKTGHKN